MNVTMKKRGIWLSLAALLCAHGAFAQEEVTLPAGDRVELHGTLCVPAEAEGAVPLVIIVAGSGPTDRNGNNPQMENNSLKMVAEALQAEGIASLRYDKRGIARSRVEGLKEEELSFDDYVADLKAWVDRYAEDRRFSKIVILGHSEGSLVGLAVATDDPAVKGFVSVAGSGRSADKLIKEQVGRQSSQLLAMIAPIVDSLKAGRTVEGVMPQLNSLFRPSVQPYLISWFRYDPAELIARVQCPVLVVQGDKDLQVTMEDADGLCAACPAARKAVIQGMNHVLKTTDTMEMQVQVIKTYMDPTLPLHRDLMPPVVAFIKDLK